MSALFSSKKAHLTKKTSSRQTTSRTHDKKNPDRTISELFLIKTRVYAREPFDEESKQFQGKTLQLLVPNSKRLRGYTWIDPRSATRFRTGKYSGNACSCSARPEGTRRSFQNSTMKCSGTYLSQDRRS